MMKNEINRLMEFSSTLSSAEDRRIVESAIDIFSDTFLEMIHHAKDRLLGIGKTEPLDLSKAADALNQLRHLGKGYFDDLPDGTDLRVVAAYVIKFGNELGSAGRVE